jgi:hypothetical protein
MHPCCRLLAVLSAALTLAGPASAQTYLLNVKPELKPGVTLRLDGNQVVRSTISDDPGFRVQYHFRKDKETLTVIQARTVTRLDLPKMEPGTYSVVVELFYPTYKGGNVQKGAFKAISNELRYRIEPGTPARVTQLPTASLQAILGIQYRPGN